MNLYRWFAAFCGVLLATAAVAEDDKTPAAYVCTFEKGNSWSHEGGAYKSATPTPLSFEITNIDLEKQSAVLVIDAKQAGTLRVVRALNANSFLEVANEGFLNLTTVYDLDSTSNTYPAVHSRHFGILGQPIFAQYAGTCTGK
ncbi:MAG TPA: hypothetical protein PLD46_06710 [Hyphomicrobium sp.]|nr:hypothetical protein [Hyphomicrobium sp.]